MTRDVDGPPFNRPDSGWYWQVLGTNLKSRSLGAEDLAPDLHRDDPDETRPFALDQAGPYHERLHLRIQRRRVGGSTVTIAVSAPARGPEQAAAGGDDDAGDLAWRARARAAARHGPAGPAWTMAAAASARRYWPPSRRAGSTAFRPNSPRRSGRSRGRDDRAARPERRRVGARPPPRRQSRAWPEDAGDDARSGARRTRSRPGRLAAAAGNPDGPAHPPSSRPGQGRGTAWSGADPHRGAATRRGFWRGLRQDPCREGRHVRRGCPRRPDGSVRRPGSGRDARQPARQRVQMVARQGQGQRQRTRPPTR